MSSRIASTLPDVNPTSKTTWLEKLREHGLDPTSICISDISKASASKLTETEYLQLKVLRKSHPTTEFEITDYVSPSKLDALDGPNWQEHYEQNLEPYLEQVSRPPNDLRRMNTIGMFVAARYFQSLVFTEISRRAVPAAPDETDGVTVNGGRETRLRSRRRGRAETRSASRGTPPRRRSISATGGRAAEPATPVSSIGARMAGMYLGTGGRRHDADPSSGSSRDSSAGHGAEGPATPWSPAAASQSPATGDEQIVNFALVLLLHAATAPIPELRYIDWTPRRTVLRLGPPASRRVRRGGDDSGGTEMRERYSLEARTDGLLRTHDGSQFPLAIVECKAYVRLANQRAVEWQEGAQLACLVADCPRVPLANYRSHGLLACPRGSGLKRSEFADALYFSQVAPHTLTRLNILIGDRKSVV